MCSEKSKKLSGRLTVTVVRAWVCSELGRAQGPALLASCPVPTRADTGLEAPYTVLKALILPSLVCTRLSELQEARTPPPFLLSNGLNVTECDKSLAPGWKGIVGVTAGWLERQSPHFSPPLPSPNPVWHSWVSRVVEVSSQHTSG